MDGATGNIGPKQMLRPKEANQFSQLPAHHLPLTAYCLLLTAYCLLLTAYCLLLTAYRLPLNHTNLDAAVFGVSGFGSAFRCGTFFSIGNGVKRFGVQA